MPIDLVPVGQVVVHSHSLCVCGHGPLWHVRSDGGCAAESRTACKCHRFRPKINTDGNRDGVYVHGAVVTDHAYTTTFDKPWGLCVHRCAHGPCRLAQSAHASTLASYDHGPLPYRCPDCVATNAETCSHP